VRPYAGRDARDTKPCVEAHAAAADEDDEDDDDDDGDPQELHSAGLCSVHAWGAFAAHEQDAACCAATPTAGGTQQSLCSEKHARIHSRPVCAEVGSGGGAIIR
jgi:hypothetical protein